MKLDLGLDSVSVSLDCLETSHFARRWPCSKLAGRGVYACFDTTGILSLEIDGCDTHDTDWDELSALLDYYLEGELPKEHPCWYLLIGQFAG